MNQDHEHLKLLSIFYYIGAALAALCACAVLILLLVIAVGSGGGATNGDELLLSFMAAFAFLLCGGMAACLCLTGKYLVERSHYNFCFVMACVVACLFVPLGTAIGVLTVLVLLRPTVKSLFGVPETSPFPAHS